MRPRHSKLTDFTATAEALKAIRMHSGDIDAARKYLYANLESARLTNSTAEVHTAEHILERLKAAHDSYKQVKG